MQNEKIIIFGDSYSTFKGYIPEGYASYYPVETHKDIFDASKTWWKMLADETGSEIILNNSWSGSTVCNIGWRGDCSNTSSFICRLNKLKEAGFFDKNNIDRVFVFGGTNDSWIGNPFGEVKYYDWTNDDLNIPLPGYCYFMDKLLNIVKKEKVHVIVNCGLKTEFENGIVALCNHYGVGYTLLSEIDKIAGHPTYLGITKIKTQILKSI